MSFHIPSLLEFVAILVIGLALGFALAAGMQIFRKMFGA